MCFIFYVNLFFFIKIKSKYWGTHLEYCPDDLMLEFINKNSNNPIENSLRLHSTFFYFFFRRQCNCRYILLITTKILLTNTIIQLSMQIFYNTIDKSYWKYTCLTKAGGFMIKVFIISLHLYIYFHCFVLILISQN